MTDWPEALVEDYLNLLDNLILLADEVDTKNNIIKNTTLVTSSPHGILATDEEIFYNTNSGPITALLPEGIDGTNYRLINVGNSGNDVTLVPFGLEHLFGANESERIANDEVLIITFETIEGWY
jgi:hypothetical protein